jgi:hypothetical protein
VDVVAEVDVACSVAELFAWVDDLGRYPEWLEIVDRALPGDDGSWAVDLRGRLGPLARSKRLRMVRSELVAGRRVVFERAEHDSRQHSAWRLSAEVTGTDTGSHLRMHLHYGGSLFGPVMERVLRDEIDRSKHRLVALAATN